MTDRTGIGGNNPPSNTELLKEKHKAIFERAAAWLKKAKRANLEPQTEADCAKLEELFGEARDIANDADSIRTAEKEPHLLAGREIDSLFNGEIRDALGTDQKIGGLARRLLGAASAKRLAITRAEQAKAAAEAEAERKRADKLAEQAAAQEARGQTRMADTTNAKVDAADSRADELAAQAAAPVAEASRARTASGRAVSVDAKLKCTGVVRADLDLETLRPYFKQDDLIAAVNAGLKMKAFDKLKGASIIEEAVGRVR